MIRVPMPESVARIDQVSAWAGLAGRVTMAGAHHIIGPATQSPRRGNRRALEKGPAATRSRASVITSNLLGSWCWCSHPVRSGQMFALSFAPRQNLLSLHDRPHSSRNDNEVLATVTAKSIVDWGAVAEADILLTADRCAG